MAAGVLVALAIAAGPAGAQATSDDECCCVCDEPRGDVCRDEADAADSELDNEAALDEPIFGVPDLNAPPFAP
jgi:hypothetical protein